MFSCVMLGGKKFCSTVLKPVSIKSSLLHFLSLFLAHFLPSSLFNSISFLCGPTKRMTIILCQIQWLVSWQLGKRTRTKTLNLECNLDCDTPSQNKKNHSPHCVVYFDQLSGACSYLKTGWTTYFQPFSTFFVDF